MSKRKCCYRSRKWAYGKGFERVEILDKRPAQVELQCFTGDQMTQEQLDKLCLEAMQRLQYFVNRCAAQQLRRMREEWSRPA